jgi:hypothetical protein
VTGTILDQYIVDATMPWPPDEEKIRNYVWYERFSALNQALYDAGCVGGKERADLILAVEKLMVPAAATSVFGHDKRRKLAAQFLAAELRSADPDCPVPPQVKVPLKPRRGKANPANPSGKRPTLTPKLLFSE